MHGKRIQKLVFEFDRFFKKNKISSDLIFAVSGGADSVFMFQLFLLGKKQGLFKNIDQFSIVHFNHQLRGKESENDEKFVVDLAKKNNIKLIVKKFRWSERPTQELARIKREKWYEKEQKNAWLVLGHQLDDQAETFIFRLLRGSGKKGLSCMTSVDIDRKRIRPLLALELTSAEIRLLCSSMNWQYCLDKSNLSSKYARNRIRQKIIPSLVEENKKALLKIQQFCLSIASESKLNKLEPVFSKNNFQIFQIKNDFTNSDVLVRTFSLNFKQVIQLQSIIASGAGELSLSNGRKILYGQNILLYVLKKNVDLKLIRFSRNKIKTILGEFNWCNEFEVKPSMLRLAGQKKKFQNAKIPNFFRFAIPSVEVSGKQFLLLPKQLYQTGEIILPGGNITYVPSSLAKAIFQ